MERRPGPLWKLPDYSKEFHKVLWLENPNLRVPPEAVLSHLPVSMASLMVYSRVGLIYLILAAAEDMLAGVAHRSRGEKTHLKGTEGPSSFTSGHLFVGNIFLRTKLGYSYLL